MIIKNLSEKEFVCTYILKKKILFRCTQALSQKKGKKISFRLVAVRSAN